MHFLFFGFHIVCNAEDLLYTLMLWGKCMPAKLRMRKTRTPYLSFTELQPLDTYSSDNITFFHQLFTSTCFRRLIHTNSQVRAPRKMLAVTESMMLHLKERVDLENVTSGPAV